MTRPFFAAGIAALGLLALGGPAAGQETAAGTLSIRSPWSRATPGGAKVGVGYLQVENRGAAPDRLVGVSSDIAGRAEIHETTTEGGVSRMRPVDGVEIKPKARVELKPGGAHLMLMDLKRPLKEGERFKATLRFEKAGPVTVEFAVRGVGAAHGGHHSH